NLCVGGGLGRSHGNEQTFPRLADVIGFFTPDKVVDVAKAVLTIHRDFGDRTNRKHARLKYVVAERGVKFMQDEVNQRAGITLAPARPYQFTTMQDLLGWRKAVDGSWFLGLFVNMGRVKDAQKTALRQVADKFPNIEFRLSANQNVILANVSDADKTAITTLLNAAAVKTENQASVLHAASMACPSLPTCGLGLGGEEIIIRSTGCPNGCARPYMAEIAFVGKAPGRYQVWLGGNASGTRLNRVWKDVVKDPDMETELRPVLARFGSPWQVYRFSMHKHQVSETWLES
ncbi:MAG: sulfite reductase, partial [Verrucomicrobia bacterium]|nr:sulfite reductase [Verrucomicrobiota bacterium]